MGRMKGRKGGKGQKLVTNPFSCSDTLKRATVGLLLGLEAVRVPLSILIPSTEALSSVCGSVEGGAGESSAGQLLNRGDPKPSE